MGPPSQTRTVRPGRQPGTVLGEGGEVLVPDAGWVLVPPGDAALTRRIKAAGPTWTVQEKVGRKLFSRGVWAPAATVEGVRRALEAERAQPTHAAKLEAGRRRRERGQSDYVVAFTRSVRAFLGFHARNAELEARLAAAVAAHATPVGSGTVARTARIPVEERAEAAVIAWLRHHTTAYDRLAIARIQGHRREVRAALARESRRLLDRYRRGEEVPAGECPLQAALDRLA